jgi:O-antigen ligase
MTSYLDSIDVARRKLAQNAPRWLKPPIALGILLFSAALPFLVSADNLMLLLGLICVAGIAVLFIHYPPLGLVALIVNGLIVPSPRLPGGLNTAVLHLCLLVGLWLLGMLVRRQDVHWIQSRPIRPLLAFVCVSLLSFAAGQVTWFAAAQHAAMDAQIGGLAIFVLAVCAFLLVAHQVRELKWLEWMTWLFVVLGALFIAAWLLRSFVGSLISALYQNGARDNAMFWTWLVALAFSQAVYNQQLHMRWRLALGGLCAATMYVAFVTNYDWKSGWLPPMVAMAAIVGARSWRIGLALALVALAPALEIGQNAIATDDYSYSTRLDAWVIVLEIVKTNPILGFGPANYYWYTPLFPIRGYHVSFNSHNQYVDIIAQTGLLGLGCYLWFLWAAGRLGWRLRTQVPAGFARAYVYGALGGLAGTLVAGMLVDWVLPFVYNIGLTGFRGSMLPWLFLGGVVSIEQMMRDECDARDGTAVRQGAIRS